MGKLTKLDRRMVIDGDQMKGLEYFDEKDSDRIFEKYAAMGIYQDMDFDINGDLVMYREY